MIQLICVDVDGTLVGRSGRVSEEVWNAAALARRHGVRLALCSGRPGFGVTRQLAERLDEKGWHAFQNGASVMHLGDGDTRSRVISPSIVAQLIAEARRTGRSLELYSDADYAVEVDTDQTRRHADLLGVPFRTRRLESLTEPIVRAQWLAAHHDVDAIVADHVDGIMMLPSLSPVMPDTTFVNMTVIGVDKALAIGVIASAYDISLDRVMMVGDGANDVSALRVAGAAVAMGNAEPEALAVARYTVGDVEHDGVVDAISLAMNL